MDNNDNIDVALLAHQSRIGLNQIYQKNIQPRIDPRQFINGGQGYYPPQGYPQMPPQGYPQQQMPYGGNVYPMNTGNVEDYGLPSAIQPNMAQLPLVMRDKEGNVIDLTQTPSVANTITQMPQTPQQSNSLMSNVNGFNVPDYSKYNPSSSQSTNYASSDESTLEIILKEIKSLKKAINKLIRETEKSKVTTATNKNTNDSISQFTNISEGISGADLGD